MFSKYVEIAGFLFSFMIVIWGQKNLPFDFYCKFCLFYTSHVGSDVMTIALYVTSIYWNAICDWLYLQCVGFSQSL